MRLRWWHPSQAPQGCIKPYLPWPDRAHQYSYDLSIGIREICKRALNHGHVAQDVQEWLNQKYADKCSTFLELQVLRVLTEERIRQNFEPRELILISDQRSDMSFRSSFASPGYPTFLIHSSSDLTLSGKMRSKNA
jgi:hypothetical protein